jgi:hypothetical protein
MKLKKYLILLFSGLLFLIFYAGTNPKGNNILQALTNNYYNFKTLDINQIYFPLSNTGKIDWTVNYQRVTWAPLEEYNTIVYNQGLWVLGKINDIPYWSYGRWSSVYSPGPIIDGEAAMLINPQDSLRYRVYKISKGDDSSNPDYQDWPVDFGAPVDDQGEPRLYADQTLWTVYNGLDSTVAAREYQLDTSDVMPVEVNQTVYARGGQDPDAVNIFSNIIFLEYNVINKGISQIDSTYIGFWTDIDFYEPWANPPGIDTVNQLGYCWSSIDSSSWRSDIPPTVGYTQLYGPLVPSEGNAAVFKGKKRSNYKNLKLSSFHGIMDDSNIDPLVGNPYNLRYAWPVAKGLDMDGNIIIDPTSGQPTRFPFSGDPVTNTGWIWENGTDGGAGFVMFSGPLTLAPGDTQWVMLALVPGLGGDRFQSIEAMRQKASILSGMPYDSLISGKRRVGIWYAGEAQGTLDKIFMKANTDSLIFQATFPNPNEHDFLATAIIKSVDNTYRDSLMLYDDGNHYDQDADDGIWGTIIPPIAEETKFFVSLIANDLNTNAYYLSNDLAHFTTIGPVVIDSVSSPRFLPLSPNRVAFDLYLKNLGQTTTAEMVRASVYPDTTHPCFINMGQNHLTFGNIEPGERVKSGGPYTMWIDTLCLRDSVIMIPFTVEISSDGIVYWDDIIDVTVSEIEQPPTIIPIAFSLKQNYPNPFNPRTVISWQLPVRSEVELTIYNILGETVTTLVSEKQAAGYHQVEWDATGFSSGVYYYRLRTDAGFVQTKKLLLLK